jgi:hypothetical protein
MNALLPAPAPPTLEQEIRRLVAAHGKEAVRAMVHELTKSKRGRKAEKDWPLLRPIIEGDAQLWLGGQEPTRKPRTNYAIAQAFAKGKPGHSPAATQRRIMSKLRKHRRFFFLVTAEQIGRSGCPCAAYMRTLEALVACRVHPVWSGMLANAQEALERYREQHGEPDLKMSFAEIEKRSLHSNNALGGLAGLLGIGGLLPDHQAK